MLVRLFTSIRAKLLACFLAACLVPFIILGFISWYHYQKTINKNALIYNQQIMSLSADKLEDFLDKLDQFYYAVYAKNLSQHLSRIQEPSVLGVKARLSLADAITQLRSYYGLSHTVPYLSIVSSGGEILYQNDLALASDYSFSQADWFLDFASSDKSAWLSSPQRLPYHESRLSGSSALYMAYARKVPLPGAARQSCYFLMEFDSQQISDLLSTLLRGSLGNLFLLSDNTPIYSLKEDQFSAKELERLIHRSKNDASFSARLTGGKAFLVNRYSLTDSPIQILCVNSMDELMANVPDLKSFTLILLLLSFFLTVLLARTFSGYLVRPISALKSVTYQVMQGNLNVSIPSLPRDETGELGKCIGQMLSHIRQLIQDKYQYSLREREMQLQTLQSQINPHFLYNTLETISGIAESEGVEEISDIALNMADLYRYSISSSDRLVPLSDELNYAQNYLNIMKVRYGERLCTGFDIDPEALDCLIMKLTLQPLIENAICHGLESKRTRGNLFLSARVEGSFLIVTVRDDGAGMSEKQLADLKEALLQKETELDAAPRHIGIGNVYQRMRLRFGEAGRLEIGSLPGKGACVTLCIPAVKQAPSQPPPAL